MSKIYEYTDDNCYQLIRRICGLTKTFPDSLVALIFRYCQNQFKNYHYQSNNLISRYFNKNNVVIGCNNNCGAIILLPQVSEYRNLVLPMTSIYILNRGIQSMHAGFIKTQNLTLKSSANTISENGLLLNHKILSCGLIIDKTIQIDDGKNIHLLHMQQIQQKHTIIIGINKKNNTIIYQISTQSNNKKTQFGCFQPALIKNTNDLYFALYISEGWIINISSNNN